LDGGNLEDLSRSLGTLADTDPKVFLHQTAKSRLTQRQLRIVLGMMPENTFDDVGKRRAAVQRRIESLLTVKDSNLGEARDEAVAYLRRVMKGLDAVRTDGSSAE